MKIFGSLTPVNTLSAQLVKEIEAECSLAAKGQSVDLKQTHAKLLRLTQAFEQEVKNSRKAPAAQTIQAQKATVSRLTNRVEALSVKKNHLPAWVKPAAYTALAVAVVAGLAFAAYQMGVFSSVTPGPAPAPTTPAPAPKPPAPAPAPKPPAPAPTTPAPAPKPPAPAPTTPAPAPTTPAPAPTTPAPAPTTPTPTPAPTTPAPKPTAATANATSATESLKKFGDAVGSMLGQVSSAADKAGTKIGQVIGDNRVGDFVKTHPKASSFTAVGTIVGATKNLVSSWSSILENAIPVFERIKVPNTPNASQRHNRAMRAWAFSIVLHGTVAFVKGAVVGGLGSAALGAVGTTIANWMPSSSSTPQPKA
jgi:hypothetical protein